MATEKCLWCVPFVPCPAHAGKKCRHCEEFFARYRCGANVGEGECDCPKCQGYCECPDYWTQENPPEDKP